MLLLLSFLVIALSMHLFDSGRGKKREEEEEREKEWQMSPRKEGEEERRRIPSWNRKQGWSLPFSADVTSELKEGGREKDTTAEMMASTWKRNLCSTYCTAQWNFSLLLHLMYYEYIVKQSIHIEIQDSSFPDKVWIATPNHLDFF